MKQPFLNAYLLRLHDGRYLDRKFMLVDDIAKARSFSEPDGISAARGMFGDKWQDQCGLVPNNREKRARKPSRPRKKKKVAINAGYHVQWRAERWLKGLCIECPRRRDTRHSSRCKHCREIKKLKMREKREAMKVKDINRMPKVSYEDHHSFLIED